MRQEAQKLKDIIDYTVEEILKWGLAKKCPAHFCKAEPGEWCHADSGIRSASMHVARIADHPSVTVLRNIRYAQPNQGKELS